MISGWEDTLGHLTHRNALHLFNGKGIIIVNHPWCESFSVFAYKDIHGWVYFTEWKYIHVAQSIQLLVIEYTITGYGVYMVTHVVSHCYKMTLLICLPACKQ